MMSFFLKKSSYRPLYYNALRSIFVQTKPTPNPNFLKFVPGGKVVMESGTMDYSASRFAHNSPLAMKLFGIDGVSRVFFGKDHISVGKKRGNWLGWTETTNL